MTWTRPHERAASVDTLGSEVAAVGSSGRSSAGGLAGTGVRASPRAAAREGRRWGEALARSEAMRLAA
eukprot:SAG11_NODE_3949_length_2136_cov_13.619539_2_plen_67_part_01